jgi:DNA-binding CsgD family transcriptional regulator
MHMMSPFKHPIFVRDRDNEDRAQAKLLGRVMACAGFGLVLVAADRTIFYANDSGRTLLHAGGGLRCEHNVLGADDPRMAKKLHSVIESASRHTDTLGQGGALILRNSEGRPSLVVHVIPLGPHSDPETGDDRPVAGLIIADWRLKTTDRIKVFAELFALTSGEARVVAQLVSGHGLGKAAARLDIAESTVRSHLTHIMEKTGTHRQAELVKLFYEVTLPKYGDTKGKEFGTMALMEMPTQPTDRAESLAQSLALIKRPAESSARRPSSSSAAQRCHA